MPFVTFKILGLVACYRKPESNFWTFVFPYDDEHHKAILSINGTVDDPPISFANKTVEIRSLDATSQTGSIEKFEEKILLLTHPRLHAEGVTMKPNVKTTKIYNAVLWATGVRDKFVIALEFNSDDLTNPANSGIIPGRYYSEISGEIEIPADKKVTINIDNQAIELSAGDKFIIDNYCGECRRDFLKYHNLFKNKGNEKKICEALSFGLFRLDGEGNPVLLSEESNKDERLGTVPIVGEPPAFCDGVLIDGDLGSLD